jgi:hypothetical protein
MLTLSVLWVVLAVAVTVAALWRKSARAAVNAIQARDDSGKVLLVAAVIYSLALCVGFFCVGKFFVAGL